MTPPAPLGVVCLRRVYQKGPANNGAGAWPRFSCGRRSHGPSFRERSLMCPCVQFSLFGLCHLSDSRSICGLATNDEGMCRCPRPLAREMFAPISDLATGTQERASHNGSTPSLRRSNVELAQGNYSRTKFEPRRLCSRKKVDVADYVAADPNFGFLKSQQFYFYFIRVVRLRREPLQFLYRRCLP